MENGEAKFTVGGIELYCAGQLITNDMEKKIAWYLMLHGRWEHKRPVPLIADGRLTGTEYALWPSNYSDQPEEYDEQGFAIVGSLSEMFSSYYCEATSQGKKVHSLKADVTPGTLGRLIPSDYKGEALPLWRMKQQLPSAS